MLDEPSIFEVEQIVDKRTLNGKVQYKVKWEELLETFIVYNC